ncbi:hypothetical protein MBLL_00759 (plasmid) [Methylobacterium bullatum]|uniref:DUF4214 domain-containing protein n=2 Tax=Methylobacterium bullatum TaxID=570505 RepID=A0A679JSN4_9HYPH|nr:hypothetical protein MBLL_00759 [Methylobacterium bullatum]
MAYTMPSIDTSAAAGSNQFADSDPNNPYTLPDSTYDYFNNAYNGYGDGSGYPVNDLGDPSLGGGDLFGPIVLDLAGNGISVTPLTSSNTFFDVAGDGYQHQTAWAGAGNGVLVIDADGDGKITQQNEVVFTEWDPTATTDMQALRDIFDTNHNGQLDAGDAQFSSFKIMVTNADGTTSLKTLAQAGVRSIDLTSDKTSQVFTDGSSVDGETTFTKTNGTTGTAATVTFAYDATGHAVKSTTTRPADGSTVIDRRAFNADGSLASETVSTVSADGLKKTLTFDTSGDGVIDIVQTDLTVNNADGSQTETLTNANASGIVQDKVTTTTSADRKTITILRDPDGNGVVDQKEVDVTASSGAKSLTVTDLNPDGSTADAVIHTVSADGQTGTTNSDVDGDGTYDLTTVDVTTTGSDGSRRQVVTDTNADASLRDRTITTTSADSLTQTIKTDADGDGVYETTQLSTIVRDSTGATTTTVASRGGSGSLLSSLATTMTSDGLSTTTRQDIDGSGTVDVTRVDATVVGADGSRTQTITDTNRKGVLLDRTTIAKNVDGVTRTTSTDADGDGNVDSVDQVVLNGSGSVTETVSNYTPNGVTLLNRATTTTSADRLTKTVKTDIDGDGKTDDVGVVQTVVNADGSATVTTSDRSRSNALLSQSIVTTSANKLSTTTQSDINGDGTYEFTSTATTVNHTAGNRVTTELTKSANGALQSKTVTALSTDRDTTTITSDVNGDGKTDTVETIDRQADGSTIDTTRTFSPDGSAVATTIKTTSATGLATTIQNDVNADGTIDTTTSDITVLQNDGSRVDTVSTLGQKGVLRSRNVITTSASGLSTITQSDADGNGIVDLVTNSVTSLNKDGSRSTTVTQAANGTTLNSTVTTTSGNGLSKTVVDDFDGDGVDDLTSDYVTNLNSSGTTTETVSERNSSGTLIDQKTVTTSVDGKSITTRRDIDGSGTSDDVETVVTQADGTKIDTDKSYSTAGALAQILTKTTSANGLSYTENLDIDADGKLDETQTDIIVINADGSKTETYTDTNMNSNIQPDSPGDFSKIVTQTSANGLSKTITVTGSNEGITIDHVTTDTITVSAGGDTTEVRNITSSDANGSFVVSSMVTTQSADGLSKSMKLDEFGNGTYNITDTTVINADGSSTETYIENSQTGSLQGKDVTTTSANKLSTAIQRDTDGDGHFDQYKSTSFKTDGSRTDAIWTTDAAGRLLDKTRTTTSADGRTLNITYDYDGDGAIDASQSQVSVINKSGSTTQTRSDYNSNGSLRDQIVTNTSANGYNITGTIDINGDGVADESFSNKTVFNTDGSSLNTVRAAYADGTVKSKTTTTTSANGLDITIRKDFNGDGKTDVLEQDSTLASGVKSTNVAYYGSNANLLARDIMTVSADGRQTSIRHNYNGARADTVDLQDHVADGNGSYDIAAEDAYSTLYEGNHLIDENGVDHVSSLVGEDSENTVEFTNTLKQEGENNTTLDQIYDVMMDRDLTNAERQSFYYYGNFIDLETAVISSTEFNQKYGATTNAEFIEQMYRNAYGRSAELSELNVWLNKIGSGNATRVDLVNALASSAEHLTIGNTHAVTNNTQNFSGTLSIDRTTDRAVAQNIVDSLYLTGLGRHADSDGSASNTNLLLNGGLTDYQIANALITSQEFQDRYGTLNDSQFVAQMFQNGLNRAPTSAELSAWSQSLTAGSISRADFVSDIAGSPDHLTATAGTPPASTTSSSTTSTADDAHSASVNRMIQAMSTMTSSSSSSSHLVTAAQSAHEPSLAAAHH